MRRLRAPALALALLGMLTLAAPAAATPVADNDGAYAGLGRVFPDPLAGCQRTGSSPCSPNAQGNTPATQFIGIDEFIRAIRYMNSKPEWQRYMDIIALDGKLGDGAGTSTKSVDPNNNVPLEFKPSAKYVSAGIPTTDVGRQKSDLMAVRVTDEQVPDEGKKRYTLSLSIHGIERAGAEGGIRAMEDLVTAFTTGKDKQGIVPKEVQANSPTFGDVLKKVIVYFTLPNPDGWRRGSVSSGGFFFQRYNGNGVDPNRDWPDIGFAYRGYSAISEPETQAWIDFYDQVRDRTRSSFSAGDDLHGQPFADALSYTLLPHGRHSYGKNIRIQDAAIAIHKGTYEAIKWSPIVVPDGSPQGGDLEACEDTGAVGTACGQIFAQTWGTVYDTINYTTTGALGDWFDSSVGLGADGIDNEMSFSHIDKNINFDPHTEQLHVDGNKALIYAHLARQLNPPAKTVFDADGRKGYVANKRLKRDEKSYQPQPPAGTVAQETYDSGPDLTPGGGEFGFPVKQGPQPQDGSADAGHNVFNGGMRVEATDTNVQGVGNGLVTLQVQCRGCDDHPGVRGDDDWVTVAEDFNQSFLYAQAGIVATVNRPQAYKRDGKPVEWRAVLDGPTATARVQVHFTQGPASASGDTGGGIPPVLRAYDVANTDFFKDLNDFMGTSEDFRTVDPRAVIAGRQSLSGFDTIALADDALPGYTGDYGGVASRPTGGPTANKTFNSQASAPGGGQGAPRNPPAGTYEDREFTIEPNDSNKSAKIQATWTNSAMDWDMYVFRKTASGALASEGSSAGGAPQTSETVVIPDPSPGTYVVRMINFAAPDPTFTIKVEFTAATNDAPPPSEFSSQEKDRWTAKLREFVQGGGNLVLTDGALRALPDIVPDGKIAGSKVQRQRVYVGQSAFAFAASGPTTTNDVLLRDTNPPGARNNTGFRRQMFEPTPLGFAIQNDEGGDASFARQYAVDKKAWEDAGGRSIAASADAGARDAGPVFDQVTIGELKLGKGQIRIAGALLPQPSEEYDHEWGLEPYAVTYSGYTVARNLLDQPNRSLAGTIGGRFIISGRAVKMTPKGNAGVRVSCRTPLHCVGKLTLYTKRATRVRGKRRVRVIKLGAAKFTIRTKTRNTVLRVKLTKSGRALVRRSRRRVRVIAKAPIKFRDGLTGSARKSFWLYRPTSRALRRR